MKISNKLEAKAIKKDINNEVKYFDGRYFKNRGNNSRCQIDFFYSGHGHPGYIALSKNEFYSYRDLIGDVVTAIDKHTITLFTDNKKLNENTFKYRFLNQERTEVSGEGICWKFKVFIDACHSGSSLKDALIWVAR